MARKIITSLSLFLLCLTVQAQQVSVFTPEEQAVIELSNKKWQWMAEKDTGNLSQLFHDNSQFVHMGGYWGKEAELNTIKDGGIWYKKAEVHKQEVKFAGPTATVYSTIHLNSVVGGHDVRFPFFVTETYLMDNGNWKLISLVFTKTLGE